MADKVEKSYSHLTTALNFGQFQGEQVYGTICGRCNNQSKCTSDYLEIEVNIEVFHACPLRSIPYAVRRKMALHWRIGYPPL